jgi:hypothetical protein
MDRRAAENTLPRLIVLGGRTLEYRFARRRRRSLGISVDGEGLRVAAPLRASWRDVESFLHAKERWILAKLEEWSRVPRPKVLKGATGESVPLFGNPLILDVRESRGRAIRHHADRLVVSAPGPGRVLETLVAWLKSRALEALAPRADYFASRLGVPPPRVGLSRGRTQWGVCMKGGAIRLSWRLVHLDPALADYAVAHEVAHLVELNHSKRFWDLVSGLYPGWREARGRLQLAGASLPIIRGAQ